MGKVRAKIFHVSATVIAVLALLTGLALLLYPAVSDYVNSLNYRRVIADYKEQVQQLDATKYEEILSAAREYNEKLAARTESPLKLSEAERAVYETMLDVTGTGIMGYIEIPSVNISLPIYHGTDEAVLQSGVGHLEGSALPVGGVGTHSILSGHRGLPSSKLFTNIDRLKEGDLFYVRVLNEVLTYEVDQIRTVEPYVLNSLYSEAGEDYCTLVTCTPYGVNTHRLLVRGRRIETVLNEDGTPAYDSFQGFSGTIRKFNPLLWIPAGIAVIVLLLLPLVIVLRRRKLRRVHGAGRHKGEEKENESSRE